MKLHKTLSLAFAASLLTLPSLAQSKVTLADAQANKEKTIFFPADTVDVPYFTAVRNISVMTNDASYTINTPSESWLTVNKISNDLWQLSATSYTGIAPRFATVDITLSNGTSKTLYVRQEGNTSAMQFGNTSKNKAILATLFEDELCTQLRSSVTPSDADTISVPYIKQLVTMMLAGGYSTEYRVGEYECYETLNTLRRRLKLQFNYNAYENPTGIYFEPGVPIIVFVEGIGSVPVSLKIKNFGKVTPNEAQSETSYPLQNGINLINPSHRGNGYVSYYSDNYASAPKIKAHFALATETGYFDRTKGDDNTKWVRLLANAKSDILDMRGQYIQTAYPVARLRDNAPTDGVSLMASSDSTVFLERKVLGLFRYNRNPKNRQLARVVWNGFMFADNVGAAATDGSISSWTKQSPYDFEFWGFGHELGHQNQIVPDFHYGGCGETTNNIFSAWCQYKLSTKKWYRLESETGTGINEYAGLAGGRMQIYFEESVRKGTPWQLVDGNDYRGTAYSTVTVKNEDYEGNRLSQDTTVQTRNMDHFIKLSPLWQLQLYGEEAGFAKDLYGKVFEGMRNSTMPGTASSGKYQLRFIELVCDSTQLDFTEFFEKSGMLRPVNAYIQDYTPDWLKISQGMIDALKQRIQAKGYPKPAGIPYYINALNVDIFKNRVALTDAGVNSGTSLNGNLVRVQHSSWANAVAFETYNSAGQLIRITMRGLGSGMNNNYSFTQVLFPSAEDASYIEAVGWDGTRFKCYQK